MGNLQKTIKKQILSEAEEKNATELYQKILTVLGYSFSEETLQQLYEKIKNLISKSYDVIDFSYDLFVSKINSIDSILANQSLAELREKLETWWWNRQVAEIKKWSDSENTKNKVYCGKTFERWVSEGRSDPR